VGTPNPGSPANQETQTTQTGLPLNPNRNAADTGDRVSKSVRPEADDGTLPAPVGDNNLVVQPIHPAAPQPNSNSGGGSGNRQDTDDPPVIDKKPSTPTTSTTDKPLKAPEDPGQIIISVHPGSGGARRPGSGGSDPVGGNGLASLVRVGSQQFQLGNYAGAARSYEQAVENGGDGIILNRRLAQAYERLGRTNDAAEAYRKCISSIDAALAAGRGNRESLSSTRGLCVQALKVLGG
jgi:hypothetical protein